MLAIWNNFCGYIQISYHRLLWVFVFACIVYLLVCMISSKDTKRDIVFRVIFSIACSFVFVMTLFNRHVADYAVTLKPFWSYYTAYKISNAEILEDNFSYRCLFWNDRGDTVYSEYRLSRCG